MISPTLLVSNNAFTVPMSIDPHTICASVYRMLPGLVDLVVVSLTVMPCPSSSRAIAFLGPSKHVRARSTDLLVSLFLAPRVLG